MLFTNRFGVVASSADERFGISPPTKQEPLVVRDKDGRAQVSME